MSECNKACYFSAEDARKDAERIRTAQIMYSKKFSKFKKSHSRLRAYQCPKCRLWHLTSQKPKNAKQKRRR